MEKYISFLVGILSVGNCCFAQYTFNIAGGNLNVVDDVDIVLYNTKWVNNGSFEAENGNVIFTGDAIQADASIAGDSISAFYNLEVNKTSNSVQLDQDAAVENQMKMSLGHLDLNGYDLFLGTTTGEIVGESENSRILGPACGEIVKVANLSNPSNENPGNLGLEITSSASPGLTIIRRGHVPQNIEGAESIKRYFTIDPAGSDFEASLRFHYFDAELNNNLETGMEHLHFDGLTWTSSPPDDENSGENWSVINNIDAEGTWSLGQRALKVQPRIFLQGPYSGGLMNDNLRSGNLLPATEPYSALGYSPVNNEGGETVAPGVLSITGDDAIVDWVFLELRDKNNSTMVVKTRAALLKRDGSIVDVDGFSPVAFTGVTADDYYLAVRHRNHLGVRTPSTLALSSTPAAYDFTTSLAQAWDKPTVSSNDAMVAISGGYGLWRADVNGGGTINVVDFILVKNGSTPNQGSVYTGADISMDGNVNIVDYIITKSQSTPNKSAHLD